MHWRAVPRTSTAPLGCSHCDQDTVQTNLTLLPLHGSEVSSCLAVMVGVSGHTARPVQVAGRTMLVVLETLPASLLTMGEQKKMVTWEFLVLFAYCCSRISVNISCSPSVCWWDKASTDHKRHTCTTLPHADEHLQN